VVLGASGGLGGTASRLAAIHPARRVIGVTGSDAKRRFMPAECTDVILGSQPGTALIEITDGRGVDVVINPVGGQLRAGAYKRLAPFGRLIVCRRRIVDRGRFRIADSDQTDQSRSLSGLSSQEVAEGVRHQLRCGTAGEVHCSLQVTRSARGRASASAAMVAGMGSRVSDPCISSVGSSMDAQR
jgi:NADPH2:quinone reductase